MNEQIASCNEGNTKRVYSKGVKSLSIGWRLKVGLVTDDLTSNALVRTFVLSCVLDAFFM